MKKIKIIKCPEEKIEIKCPFKINPTRIVIHNTANDASAYNEIKYMHRNNREVSFHFAVDDIEIIEGIDLNRNAWHAGDGHGKGNMEGIAIEICYSLSGGERFEKAQKNAAELTAFLLKSYGWDITKVTKHQDYNGKHCPHRTLDDYGWEYFLNLVRNYIDEDNNSEIKESTEKIANEVISGKWGNGKERKAKLETAGYDYNQIQKKVNEILADKKDNDLKNESQIVDEIIMGKWGNGTERKDRLQKAGYNYQKIQAAVNEKLK